MFEEHLDSVESSFLGIIDQYLGSDFQNLPDADKQEILQNLIIKKQEVGQNLWYLILSTIEDKEKSLSLEIDSTRSDAIQPRRVQMTKEETKGDFSRIQGILCNFVDSKPIISHTYTEYSKKGQLERVYSEESFVDEKTGEKSTEYFFDDCNIKISGKKGLETNIKGLDDISDEVILSAANFTEKYCNQFFDRGEAPRVTLSDFWNAVNEVGKGRNIDSIIKQIKDCFLRKIDENLGLNFGSLPEEEKQKILNNLKIRKSGIEENHYSITSRTKENENELLLGFQAPEADMFNPDRYFMSNEKTNKEPNGSYKDGVKKLESITRRTDGRSSNSITYTGLSTVPDIIYDEEKAFCAQTGEKSLSYHIGDYRIKYEKASNGQEKLDTNIRGLDNTKPLILLTVAHLLGEYCEESFQRGIRPDIHISDFRNAVAELNKGKNEEEVLKKIQEEHGDRSNSSHIK